MSMKGSQLDAKVEVILGNGPECVIVAYNKKDTIPDFIKRMRAAGLEFDEKCDRFMVDDAFINYFNEDNWGGFSKPGSLHTAMSDCIPRCVIRKPKERYPKTMVFETDKGNMTVSDVKISHMSPEVKKHFQPE